MEDNLGNGPLTLGIFCIKCDAQYELNKDGVAVAIVMNTPFREYIRFVQNGSCPNCQGIKANECCRRIYAECDPIFGIPDGFIYVKEDGSRCPEHDPSFKVEGEQCQP
jgi:hypothetical protein